MVVPIDLSDSRPTCRTVPHIHITPPTRGEYHLILRPTPGVLRIHRCMLHGVKSRIEPADLLRIKQYTIIITEMIIVYITAPTLPAEFSIARSTMHFITPLTAFDTHTTLWTRSRR